MIFVRTMPNTSTKEDFIEKEKSGVVIFISGLLGTALIIAGYIEAPKHKVDVWEGMLIVLKNLGHWMFMVLAAIFLGFLVYLVVKVSLEKLIAFYVAWENSQEWCEKINQDYENSNLEINKLKYELSIEQKNSEAQLKNMNFLYKQLKELREFTSIDAIKAQAEAEKAIEQSAQ